MSTLKQKEFSMRLIDIPQIILSTTPRDYAISKLQSSPIYGSKQWLALALVATLSLFLSTPAGALTAQEIFRQASERIWVLETLDAKNTLLSSTSAMLIETDKAIAQCDVLQGANSLRLAGKNQTFPVERIGGADREGLCLLAIPQGIVATSVAFHDKDPEIGIRVFAVSNALSLGLSISEGVVSGLREFHGNRYIQFTSAIAPGSEGGGLFDADGQLIGFITYRALDGQNVNFAIPIRRLANIEKRLAAASAESGLSATATALEQAGQWTALAQHAQQWLAADAGSSEAWTWLGYAAQQTGNWPEVERAFREVLKLEPRAIGIGVLLARALTNQKKYQEAADVARSLLVWRQEDARIWAELGLAELNLDQAAQAKLTLGKALQLDPWNFDAHLALAHLARNSGDWRTVASSHRAISRIAPDDIRNWLLLAEAYLHEQRPQRALASAERALALAPDSGDAKLFKGAALVKLNRQREGMALLKQAAAGNTRRPSWALEFLGVAYYDLKMYPESIDALTKAMKLDPTSVSIKQNLGLALKDGLRFAEALAIFEALRQANPDAPFPWRQIGYVHAFILDSDKAIPAFKQSLQLDSNQPKVWQALIETYHVAGRKEEMKRAYEQLRTINIQTAETVYQRMLLPYEGSAP